MKSLTYLFTVIWLFVLVLLTVLLAFDIVPQDKVHVVLIGVVVGFIVDSLIRSTTHGGKIQRIIDSIEDIRDTTATPNVGLIKEPKFDDTWVNYHDMMDAFNAPWSLAEDTIIHILEFYSRSKKMMNSRVLLFEGRSEAEKALAATRRERMRICITRLAQKRVPMKDSIRIRQVDNENLPGSSFFLCKKQGKDIALMYVYPFMREDVPEFALEITKIDIVKRLRTEFDIWWSKARDIPLDEFLSQK